MGKITLFYDEMTTPIGPLLMISDGENIIRIDFGTIADLEIKVDKWVKRYIGEVAYRQDPAVFTHAKNEIEQYFNGERQDFSFPIAYYGTDFQKAVWESLLRIVPFGETKTYGDVARNIDNPKAVRAVGGAVNKNPFSIVIPCHRIIGQSGKLVGYGGGIDKKKYLLTHEGVSF